MNRNCFAMVTFFYLICSHNGNAAPLKIEILSQAWNNPPMYYLQPELCDGASIRSECGLGCESTDSRGVLLLITNTDSKAFHYENCTCSGNLGDALRFSVTDQGEKWFFGSYADSSIICSRNICQPLKLEPAEKILLEVPCKKLHGRKNFPQNQKWLKYCNPGHCPADVIIELLGRVDTDKIGIIGQSEKLRVDLGEINIE